MNAVSAGVVRYFTDGRHPGRWSAGADRLLSLRGPVEAATLRLVLQGRHPGGGRFLPPVRPNRRRGGWDLIFAAPKSLSLLAASVPAGDSSGIGRAHSAAVDGVMQYVEQRLTLWGSGPSGAPLRADGLISASFEHTENAAGEPHLHSHVLVANLSCSAGHWGHVNNGEWFVGRSALAALYQLELRHQLERQGWHLDWGLRPDGLADLAEVPRAAVRAASTQSRRAETLGWYEARRTDGRQPGSDRPASSPVRQDRRSSAGAGPAARPAALDDPSLERAVAIRLTSRRSDFRRADVLVALASCHPGGASAGDAALWADRFCGRSRPAPSPTAGRRWTTEGARRIDDELIRLLSGRQLDRAAGAVPEPVLDAALQAMPWLSEQSKALVHELTATPAPVHVLGAEPGTTALLAQAEVLHTCRAAWESAGLRVAVSSPRPDGELRWDVLAGLAPYRYGDRPDVLVVDRADRRTTSEIARLAGASSSRLIFVEGGTLPRLTNPASHGLAEVAALVGRRFCPEHQPWAAARALPGIRDEPLPEVGRPAAERLLGWWRSRADQPLLVGLGLEEVVALNRAARGGGPAVRRSGIDRFREGDRLIVLKRAPGLPTVGTFGAVTEAPAGEAGRRLRGSVGVAWEDGTATVTADGRVLAAVGHGYAVTPRVAARTARDLVVLGPGSALGRGRERVIADVGRAPSAIERRRGREFGFGS